MIRDQKRSAYYDDLDDAPSYSVRISCSKSQLLSNEYFVRSGPDAVGGNEIFKSKRVNVIGSDSLSLLSSFDSTIAGPCPLPDKSFAEPIDPRVSE